MSSAVTGKGVPVRVPSRSSRSSVLRFARMAVAFVVVAGSLGLATVTATAQSGGGSCPSDDAEAYSDVPESSYAYDDSRCLRELGISDDGDTYRPGDDMTRSEMAAFMANAYEALTGMEAPIEEHMFEDVADDPNAEDIARISPNGLMITTGKTPTTYAPADPVQRKNMARFLTRLYKAVTGSEAPTGETPFTDLDGVAPDALSAIGAIYMLKVTTGTTDTTYSPDRNVTREEMASFVARMYRAIDEMAEAPAAPTGVTVAVSGEEGDSLDVSWEASDDADSYVVQWKSGDDDYSADNQRSTDDMSTNFDGLTKGTAYTFRIAAVNEVGQGDWSDEASGSPGTVPGAVGKFAVAAGSVSGTLDLTWEAPADDGGTPITGYVVQWATGREAPSMAQIDDGSATSYTITGLKIGVEYRVHIQAVNGAGEGAITAPASAEQRTATPSTSVSSGSVTVALPRASDPAGSLGGRFASLTWRRPTLQAGQHLLAVGAYHIQRKCGTENWPAGEHDASDARSASQGPAAATARTAIVTLAKANVVLLGGTDNPGDLTNGVECTFRVRANTYLDANNNQAQDLPAERTLAGAWATGSGTPVGVPGAPGSVVNGNTTVPSVEVANRALNVSWAAPMTADTPAKVNDGGSPITGYKVSWASGGPIGDVTVSASTTSHMITGLTNGLYYTVSVQAINARGASAATAAAAASPAAVPGAPGSVRVSQPAAPAQGQADQRGNQLIVSWSAPAANGTGAITGYVVERRTSATTTPQAAAGDWADLTTPHTGTGTMVTDAIDAGDRGTSYDYRVRAVNATVEATRGLDGGPWSAFASGTAAALPSAVVLTNIEVIAGNGSLTLTWTAAVGNGSEVTHYLVRHARNAQGTEQWSSQRRVPASALPTYTIGGLANGVPYIVGITAVNSVGSSTETQTDGTHRPTFAQPAPSTVTAVPASSDNNVGDKITVTWSAVAGAVGYLVEYRAVNAAAWTAVTPPPTVLKEIGTDSLDTFDATKERKALIGSLTETTTYVVRVLAVTQGQVGGNPAGPALRGTPGFSAPVKAEGTPSIAPGSAAVAQQPKTTTLRVTWTPPSNAEAEGVTGYRITWYPTATAVVGNRGSATVAADAKSYDITGLTAVGSQFTVTVAAINKIGVGLARSVTTTTPLAAAS